MIMSLVDSINVMWNVCAINISVRTPIFDFGAFPTLFSPEISRLTTDTLEYTCVLPEISFLGMPVELV